VQTKLAQRGTRPPAGVAELETTRRYTHDDVLLEYGELRKELLQNDQMMLSMLGFMLAFSGASLTFAFGQWLPNPALAAAALFVTEGVAIVVALETLDRARNTFMKASYLRVFVERPAVTGLRWESRLQQVRGGWPALGFGRFEGFSGHLWVNGFIVVFAAMANVMLVVPRLSVLAQNELVLCGGLCLVSVVCAGGALWQMTHQHALFVLRNDQTFDERWLGVLADETPSDSPS
jgi:hypothetical protein